jgi:hypothetical protein
VGRLHANQRVNNKIDNNLPKTCGRRAVIGELR